METNSPQLNGVRSMPISALTNIPPSTPINSVTPFTYRDNQTYLSLLEQLRVSVNTTIDYINDVSVYNSTEINIAITAITAELNATLESALTTINASTDTLVEMETTLGVLQTTLTETEADITDKTAQLTTLLATIDGDLADRYTKSEADARYVKTGRTVSIWDYAAVGDGVADDTNAIIAASNAAGPSGTVKFNRGTFGQSRFKISAGITMPDFQTWDSESNGRIGGTAAESHIDASSLTVGAAITMGRSSTLRNLRIAGPGSSVAAVTGILNVGSTQMLDAVSVVDFGIGCYWNNVYYGQMVNETEFARCGTAIKLTQCYNVTLFGTRIHCLSTDGTTRGTGINITDKCRSLNVIGGSIEQYSTGVVGASNSGHNFYGVYWETAAGNAKGIDCNGKSAFNVNVRDCTAYLAETLYWVNVAGGTNFVLNGGGNHFVCAASTAPATPTAYFHGANPVGDIRLEGDSWADVTLAGTLYVPDVSGVYPRMTVVPPGTIDSSYVKQGRASVRPVKVVSAAYTITTADETILADTTTVIVITLPPRAGLPVGRKFEVKNLAKSTANVSVNRTDGFLENGTVAIVLAPGEKGVFMQDGANWHRMSS